MLFLCYPKCSTCRKAKDWLDTNSVKYEERHIVEDNPTYEELKKWNKVSGLPLKKFFNLVLKFCLTITTYRLYNLLCSS